MGESEERIIKKEQEGGRNGRELSQHIAKYIYCINAGSRRKQAEAIAYSHFLLLSPMLISHDKLCITKDCTIYHVLMIIVLLPFFIYRNRGNSKSSTKR